MSDTDTEELQQGAGVFADDSPDAIPAFDAADDAGGTRILNQEEIATEILSINEDLI